MAAYSNPTSRLRQKYWLATALLLVLATTIYLLGNNLTPLIDRDEPRYAQASRQMLLSGDWITPMYLDQLRLKKPIFIYWLQASSMKLFGETAFAARLPSVIASVFTLALFAMAWPRIVGYRRSIWAAFIFATMFLSTYLAKVCMTDGVLHFFIAASMLCLYAIWVGKARAWMLIAMGVVLGGSMLTKGPPAFLFLGMTMLALWVLGFTIRRDEPTHSISPMSALPKAFAWTIIVLGIAIGVCIPWALAMEKAHPGALLKMFFDEVVKRAGEAQEGHTGPPGFYFVTFWATAFPWCLFWPAALWHGWRRRSVPWIRFCLAAILGPWLFLEFYKTKLPHYWLPSYPFMALLIADVLVLSIRGRINDLRDKPFVIATGIACALVALLGVAIVFVPSLGDSPDVLSYLTSIAMGLGLIAGAWGVFELIRRHEITQAAVVMGLSCWAMVAFAFSVFVPTNRAFTLCARVAETLRSIGAANDAKVGDIRMIEFKEPSLAFYQGGTIREQDDNTLSASANAPRWVVISDETLRRQNLDAINSYKIVRSFRGIPYADGNLQVTVHILERKSPTTRPAKQ